MQVARLPQAQIRDEICLKAYSRLLDLQSVMLKSDLSLQSKGKGKSHSLLAVGEVNVRIPLVSMRTACKGWCLSLLPSKSSPALKIVGYLFAAG